MNALSYSVTRLLAVCRLSFVFVLLMLSNHAAAQKITIVTVNAQGYGATKAEALADAVVNGIAQVNGEAVASSMKMKTKDFASSDGTETSSRSIEESISRKTKGVVRSWRQIELVGSGAGDYNASVEVNVVVLQKSVQLNRIKIAVVPPSGDRTEATRALNEELTNLLTSSRKFAIMDRRNEGAIASQLDRIREGGSIEDQVRLTGEVAPDVIAVTGARITSGSGSKRYAEATMEIIDYASRQVKFAAKKRLPLKAGNDTSNRRRIAMLAKGLSRAVIETMYPPTIVGVGDGFVTIAQGSDFFAVGDKLVVKRMGAALKDPHTDEFLGYDQSDIGTAVVVFVDKRISRAKVDGTPEFDSMGIVNRAYQVARTGQSSGNFFAELTAPGTGPGTKKKASLFTTDAFDDDDDD
jgi:hypothetical protein